MLRTSKSRTLNKYGSVSAYDNLEEAAKNDQTSGTGELDSAKTDAKANLDGTKNLSNAKNDAKAAIDKLENLNDAQKAAKEAIDNATTPNDVTTAQDNATTLNGKMGDLATSVSDVEAIKATGNYTNASEAAKQAYDDAVAKAQAILDKLQGTNEDAEAVAAAKQAVEDAKKGLDGDSKLADAKTAAKGVIDQLENLNDAQKAAAKNAVDQATTPNDVTTAQSDATILDGKMGDLATSVSDVDTIKSTGNYTNASEAAKQAYDDAVAKAQAILDKSNGTNASAAEVMAAKQAVDNAKKALNGKPNVSGHEGNEDAMTKGTTSTPVTESSVSATSQQSGSQTASKQLPQTGDDTSQALVTFGLGGTLLGLLGIASRKRKKLN